MAELESEIAKLDPNQKRELEEEFIATLASRVANGETPISEAFDLICRACGPRWEQKINLNPSNGNHNH